MNSTIHRIESNLTLIQDLANKYNCQTEIRNIINQHKHFKIRLPFIGAFSTGKSSFINTFLNEKLLSVAITPKTAIATELYFSPENKIELVNQDQVIKPLTKDELKDQTYLNRINNANKNRLWINAGINNHQLQPFPELVLVDMPGWESGIEQHSLAIDNYIDRSGAYYLTVSAEQGTLNQSLKYILNELKIYKKPVILLITKSDKRTDEDLIQLTDNIKQAVTETLGYPPLRTLTVSNRKKMLNDFDTTLQLVYSQEENIYKNIIGSQFKNQFNQIKKSIEILLNKDNFSLEELELQKEEIPAQLEKLKNELDKNQSIIDTQIIPDSVQYIKSGIQNKLNENLNSLSLDLLNQRDINNHISFIIRDTFLNTIETYFKPKINNRIVALYQANEFTPGNLNFKFNYSTTDKTNNFSNIITHEEYQPEERNFTEINL